MVASSGSKAFPRWRYLQLSCLILSLRDRRKTKQIPVLLLSHFNTKAQTQVQKTYYHSNTANFKQPIKIVLLLGTQTTANHSTLKKNRKFRRENEWQWTNARKCEWITCLTKCKSLLKCFVCLGCLSVQLILENPLFCLKMSDFIVSLKNAQSTNDQIEILVWLSWI